MNSEEVKEILSKTTKLIEENEDPDAAIVSGIVSSVVLSLLAVSDSIESVSSDIFSLKSDIGLLVSSVDDVANRLERFLNLVERGEIQVRTDAS